MFDRSQTILENSLKNLSFFYLANRIHKMLQLWEQFTELIVIVDIRYREKKY